MATRWPAKASFNACGIDLAEREREVARLRRELARGRESEATRAGEAVEARWEHFLSQAAAPATQLLTQAHLLEDEGKPVQARDVLAVARRLVRALEDEGLQMVSAAGRREAYDPARHELLQAGETPPAGGQPVEVKFAGAAYRGRIIVKAGVIKV